MTISTIDIFPTERPIVPWLQGGGECGALLRAMDWSVHPLGPPHNWDVLLQATVSLMLSSRQPMFLCWGPELHTLYNDQYAIICGDRHPAGLGAKCSDLWYDIWDVVDPMIKRVKHGDSIQMDDIRFDLLRNGQLKEAHFSFSYNPLRDVTDQIQGIFCACSETTQQVMLQRDLDHKGAQVGEVFQQASNFTVKLAGPDHVIELANPAYMQLIGNREIVGKPMAEALPEVVNQGLIDVLDSVYRTAVPARIDGAKVVRQRAEGDALEVRFVDFVYQPLTDADGTTTGLIASGNDVTARIEASAELAKSEQFLRSIISTTADCIKVLDLQGRITFMNDGGRQIMEIPDDYPLVGAYWPDFWQEPLRAEVIAALEAAKVGQLRRFQGYATTICGNRRFWDVRVAPMLDESGQPDRILAVSRDNTYLKQIEDQREHVMKEVSHRLKNAFGMVQSVINQTLRQAKSVQEGREILTGRVRALAAAQDILTQSSTSEMFVADVVEAALLPHLTGEGRFEITGPSVLINGRQSLGLSLALHELATNATKYGALSGDTGRVAIRWTVQADGVFDLRWQEAGGPPVKQPAQTGFGSVLIETIVATYFDGAAKLDYAAHGVVFRLQGVIKPPDADEVTDPYLT